VSAGGAAGAATPAAASRAAWVADPRLPSVLLGIAAVASAIVLVVLNSKLTFFIDDWEVLLHRRGLSLDVFLEPHAGHPSMGLVALYKAIQVSFGMESLTPYAVASTAFFLVSVVLLFVWMRRRVGPWLALAGALPILFLGAAYEDLLTPFQVGYFAPMAFGLGALLVLERGRPRDPALCCALLIGGLSFQTIGLAFVAGVAVALALDGELRRLAWVPIVPAALYGLWYLGWGHTDSTQFSFDNLATSPAFVIDGFAASVSSLLGFATPGDGALAWGRPLLAVLVVLAAARLLSRRAVPKGIWVVLAIGVVFWIMIALNASQFRSAETSRYQFLGAIFVLMLAAEVWRGVRPDRVVVGLALVASVAAVAGNLVALRDAYRDLHALTPVVRGDLAALEIAADRVDPGLVLDRRNAGFDYFTLLDAGSYLSAAEKFGSPAYDQAELAAAPESGRAAADRVLSAALGLRLEPTTLSAAAAARCRPLAGAAGAAPATLPPGGAILRAAGTAPAKVDLRRFATEDAPVELGRLDAGRAAVLAIPTDRSPVPWQLQVPAGGRLELCGPPEP
jgi:hypothetical protein